MPTDNKIKRHLCPNCGADMVFEPAIGKLGCPYCDSNIEISSNLSDIKEQDLEAFRGIESKDLRPLAVDAMQVTCDSCGATVTFVPPTTATSCDFCAAKLVAQPKNADPLVAPEGILPFSVAGRDASASLKKWTASRWFAPNALKSMSRHDKAESIYVPYWTFDADTETGYTGERGEDYQESEYYTDSQGKRQSRLKTLTRWHSTAGHVERHFDDMQIPATTSVLPDYLSRLDWDLTELASYDPAYLSGHKAQTYQVSLEAGYERFRTLSEQVIRSDVRRDIGGDKQKIDSMNTTYSVVTFKHILVPVYAGAYKFNNKAYQVVINGRTGEVLGERPYSVYKLGCLVAFIVIVILLVILLGSIFAS